jgi:CheY-like chemotaxis protein
MQRARALDVSAYVVKPVSQADLFSALARALGARAAEAANRPAPKQIETSNHSLQVLLAEDNRVNQRLAAHLLERAGHQVVLAENGVAAVDAFARQTFDLILMDLQMPEMGGIEATGEIRKMEAKTGAHTPIIALTAHAMQGDRERCERASMDGYVSKPIRREQLFAEIERVVKGGTAPAAPSIAFDGDADLLPELATMFLEDYPPRLQEMRNALALRDGERIMRAAHSFKGAAAVLCGPALIELSTELEEAAEQRSFDTVERLIGRIDAALSQLKPALESAAAA